MTTVYVDRERLREALRPVCDELISVLIDVIDASQNPAATKERTKSWLTTKEAAEFLGLNAMTLTNWRSSQREGQPPYHKFGGTVKYRRTELERWIEHTAREPMIRRVNQYR